MVMGFKTFREAFKGYEDCYTIIGGTACDILMDRANFDFRATRDIDMIITPLHISDKVSSLSAIMLNDDYYEFMMNGRKVVNGVGVLGAEYLIPL